MATEVVMPKLGLTMERGTIGAWLKREGESVTRGEALLEIVTDKVTMEVEAQASGVLRQIFVAAGEEVAVATPIGVIADADEDVSAFGPAGTPRPRVAEPRAAVAGPAPSPPPVPGSARRPHRASPKARRIAAERGLDATQLRGSGPGGRVVSADVEAMGHVSAVAAVARSALPTPVAGGPVVELTRAQRVAGERLTASYQQAPHIYLEIGVSAVWLEQFRAGYAAEGKRVSYNDLVVKATATALVDHPRLNSHFADGRVHLRPAVDIGIATDTEAGLLVPVLRNVQTLTLEEIAAESRRLVEAARHGRLGPDDMHGGSFTVSNLGMLGVSRFTAILNPPQVAILAVGAVERTVVALDNDAIAVRPVLRLTLSADHRAVDGAMAARFLQCLKTVLESPGLLA